MFPDEKLGFEKIHDQLVNTLGNDAYGISQFKI
jgi:hypothetical protein